MIAFTLICLMPAALLFAGIPIVVFGLMLESARRVSPSAAAGKVLFGSGPAGLGTTTVHGLQLS